MYLVVDGAIEVFVKATRVASLGAGATLGEVGVLYGRRRTADCFSGPQGVLVAEVRKEDVELVLGDMCRQRDQGVLATMRNMRCLATLPDVALAGMKFHAKGKEIHRGEFVYKAGQKDAYIYGVLAGELELVAHHIEEQPLAHTKRIVVFKDGSKANVTHYKELKEVKDYQILKLAKGNYFGDEEGFLEEKKQYSIRVVSETAHIFMISKQLIFANVIGKEQRVVLYSAGKYRNSKISERLEFLKQMERDRNLESTNTGEKKELHKKSLSMPKVNGVGPRVTLIGSPRKGIKEYLHSHSGSITNVYDQFKSKIAESNESSNGSFVKMLKKIEGSRFKIPKSFGRLILGQEDLKRELRRNGQSFTGLIKNKTGSFSEVRKESSDLTGCLKKISNALIKQSQIGSSNQTEGSRRSNILVQRKKKKNCFLTSVRRLEGKKLQVSVSKFPQVTNKTVFSHNNKGGYSLKSLNGTRGFFPVKHDVEVADSNILILDENP